MKRIVTILIAALGITVVAAGCDGGREGERCNPNLSHNECNDGLTCQQIGACGESYCCPADPSKSSHVYCNGKGFDTCPAPDASAGDDAGDASASDSPAADSAADSPRDAPVEAADGAAD